jgi:hypothetical protein
VVSPSAPNRTCLLNREPLLRSFQEGTQVEGEGPLRGWRGAGGLVRQELLDVLQEEALALKPVRRRRMENGFSFHTYCPAQ